MKPLCNYFGYLFLSYCLIDKPTVANRQIGRSNRNAPTDNSPSFEIEYQWQFINFTWPSRRAYERALRKQEYIPPHVTFAASKYYNGRIYLCLPQVRSGVPVTLGSIPADSGPKLNPLVEPFPSWEMSSTTARGCSGLKNVQSFEIDENGIMWVIDGMRTNDLTDCPPKLVLLDLNKAGEVLLSYIFPKEVCLSRGGYLNDIVVDNTDGGFAYITDASSIDPGLVVYSREKNRAWKLRDISMFGEISATRFVVGNITVTKTFNVDGLALSPVHSKTGEKLIIYCSLSTYNLYGLSTKYAKNEDYYKNGNWRGGVKLLGKKQSQADGMIVDAKGNLYYTLIPPNGIGKWNINTSFNESQIIFTDEDAVWTDSLSIDSKGYLRLLADNFQRFGIYTGPLEIPSKVIIRIYKANIGNKSYLY